MKTVQKCLNHISFGVNFAYAQKKLLCLCPITHPSVVETREERSSSSNILGKVMKKQESLSIVTDAPFYMQQYPRTSNLFKKFSTSCFSLYGHHQMLKLSWRGNCFSYISNTQRQWANTKRYTSTHMGTALFTPQQFYHLMMAIQVETVVENLLKNVSSFKTMMHIILLVLCS